MASNYPTSLDTFSNPSGTDSLNSPSHSLQHADINDAVEALETKIGIGDSPAGSATAGQVLTAQGGGTAIWASGAGLVHISNTTWSGVSTVSLPNDTFTSEYSSYKIVLQIASSVSTCEIRLRMRASGSDDAGSNYVFGFTGTRTNNSSFNTGTSGATSFLLTFNRSTDTDNMFANFDVIYPKLAKRTKISSLGYGADVSTAFSGSSIGFHALQTAYDSLTILTSTGNFAGTIEVWGYKS